MTNGITRNTGFTHSIPVPAQCYEQEGYDYFCRFTPRIHRDHHLADEGSWQCQVDFLNASGPKDSERNKDHKAYAVGCINHIVGNFSALCLSEALPERLAITTYLVEYAYIHDDGTRCDLLWSALADGSSSNRICRGQDASQGTKQYRVVKEFILSVSTDPRDQSRACRGARF